MPRFAQMISDGMQRRGHDVQIWTASQVFSRFGKPHGNAAKWLGYVDQFAIYPMNLRRSSARLPDETLFVFTDCALCGWLKPLVDRPHVIHCHDFLAQKSALGAVDNPVSWTGRHYQKMIRRGFRRGKNFISVSENTRDDLHGFLDSTPELSRVVYNGFNGPFRWLERGQASEKLSGIVTPHDDHGFLLHVGGNQWYKNRKGVIDIYAEYCRMIDAPLPIWMVGAEPSASVREAASIVPPNGELRFLASLDNEQVIAAYNLASLTLFPSLAEGFGWPIVESMACGTPVITTNAAPMTEVGGDAAIYLRKRTSDDSQWARDGALLIQSSLSLDKNERAALVSRGLGNAQRFSTESALDQYEKLYSRSA